MTLNRRDWIFIAVILVVLAVFFAISGEEKTVKMPKDATHQPLYQLLAEGQKRIDVDARCPSCHDGKTIPFPPNHPLKPGSGPMRCLFCHKLEQ